MKNKLKIIVTGGMGYIGSHTAVELTASGFETIILDNLENSEISVLEGIKSIAREKVYFEEVDLTNKEDCFAAIRKYDNIAGIIHFAAYKAVGESMNNPLKYYRNNLDGLFNVLEAINVFEIDNLIFSSSCTVYGDTKDLPVTEKTEKKRTFSPYGVTKQIGERVISDFCYAHKSSRAISLRYFNPIGAHPSGAIGELPLGKPENLMPYITQTAAGLRDQLSVFGGDYDTADGTAIRDYIHVVDLAQAHIVALQRLLNKQNKAQHEFFNLGSGKGYSVLEVIQSFEKTSGLKLNYEIVDRRTGDIASVYADTQLSKQELNWQANMSLDDMTRTAWQWEKKLRNID
jgi:UDP-glucose 4-epimerase